jgi:hypothetical protein
MQNRLFELLIEGLSPEAKRLLLHRKSLRKLGKREKELLKEPVANSKELATLGSTKSGHRKGRNTVYQKLGDKLVAQGTRERVMRGKPGSGHVSYKKVKK